MKPASPIVHRSLTVLPAITAIVFHAVALDRWLIAIPALLASAVFVTRELSVTMTSRRVYAVSGLGLVAGLVIPVGTVTSSTLPPGVIGAATKRTFKRSSVEVRVETDPVDPNLRQIYGQYIRALQEAGIVPQPWETDEEIIARLAASDSSTLTHAAKGFITCYQSSRFGGEVLDANLTGQLANRHG